MINICHNCGQYRADKIIDPTGPFAICPLCQHQHPFRQLPLFIVCGPSGSGKSTVCQRLVGTEIGVIILDADILWQPAFNNPDNHYRDFFETWLRLGKNINQSGRPLVLFNAGSIPDNIEPCIERRYYREVYYLALICDDEVLVERLKQRPGWRQSQDEAFITKQIEFNHWFKASLHSGEQKITLLDTTDTPINRTVEQVATWINERI